MSSGELCTCTALSGVGWGGVGWGMGGALAPPESLRPKPKYAISYADIYSHIQGLLLGNKRYTVGFIITR